jgi:ribonuclease HI
VSRQKLFIYTDGAARGNPGPAGIGAQVQDSGGNVVAEECRYIGEATNNVAEYRALLLGLERATELGASTVEVRTDSELIVKQLSGEYRVRSVALRALFERVKELASAFQSVDYVHVPRELNRAADRLANRAIDTRKGA